jgi:hypothetical protein
MFDFSNYVKVKFLLRIWEIAQEFLNGTTGLSFSDSVYLE